MVGRLSRIRVSSVMRTLPPRTSVGTLKSTRTSTRFPRTSRSRTESFILQLKTSASRSTSTIMTGLIRQQFHQLHAAIAVAPFVIIPADHLYEAVAHRQRQLAIEDAGMRIANNVFGNERFIAELEHAFVAFI